MVNLNKNKARKARADKRYLEKKFQKELKTRKSEMIEGLTGNLKIQLQKLTRILFNDVKDKCDVCSSVEDLHIHHKKYTYPIQRKDLKILCRRHHVEEHHKLSTISEGIHARKGKTGNLCPSSKKVEQINIKTGEVIKTWDSNSDAGRFLKKCPSSISQVCNGKGKTAYGFKWRYKKSE